MNIFNKPITKTAVLLISSLLLSACDAPNQDKTQRLSNTDVAVNTQRGDVLFQKNCARCHGKKGVGTNQGPPLMHKIYRPGHHPDQSFYRALKNGSRQHHWKFGNMPPLPNVSPQQVGHIITYVRQEQHKVGIR